MSGRYGLQIRTATVADAAGIAALMNAEGHGAAIPAWTARLEAFGTGSGTVLLAIEWGPPSGLVALAWHRSLLADDGIAQIDTLIVGRDERRRGIGRLLLKAGAQAARSAGCGTIRLLTHEADTTLEAFARATGFDANAQVLTRALRKSGMRG